MASSLIRGKIRHLRGWLGTGRQSRHHRWRCPAARRRHRGCGNLGRLEGSPGRRGHRGAEVSRDARPHQLPSSRPRRLHFSDGHRGWLPGNLDRRRLGPPPCRLATDHPLHRHPDDQVRHHFSDVQPPTHSTGRPARRMRPGTQRLRSGWHAHRFLRLLPRPEPDCVQRRRGLPVQPARRLGLAAVRGYVAATDMSEDDYFLLLRVVASKPTA